MALSFVINKIVRQRAFMKLLQGEIEDERRMVGGWQHAAKLEFGISIRKIYVSLYTSYKIYD